MGSVTGFLFSQASIEELIERGFDFIEDPAPEGFRIFKVILNDSEGFQFHVISDENLYRQSHPVEHFAPFLSEFSPSGGSKKQGNTVYRLEEILTEKNLADGDLYNYLRIRKLGGVWALHLNCENFEVFCQRAKPDKFYDLHGKPAALIHLGPSSFDLLITERKVT